MSINKQFKRTIESMGSRLILAKISLISKPIGLFYHQLFERDGKPSLDIALNPKDGTIVYVNFILQDESLVYLNSTPAMEKCELQFTLPAEEITTNNYHHFSHAEFTAAICDKDLWVFRNDFDSSLFDCYSIDDENGLLFKNGVFLGIVFKKLSDYEIEQLHISGYG